MLELGEPAWRGSQLAEAIYRQRVARFLQSPLYLRRCAERLAAEGWQVGRPRIAQVFQSVDGTERYLIECPGPARRLKPWKPSGCPKATTAKPATARAAEIEVPRQSPASANLECQT